MKNRFLLLLALFAASFVTAQDLANKIPVDAKVVATIKGKNVLALISLDEFSNSKIGERIAKELNRETKGEIEAIEDLGLALDQNFYYFLQTREGVFYNVFMMPFKDTSSINKQLQREQEKIIKEDGFSYTQEKYGGDVLMWTKNTALMVIPSDQNKTAYNDFSYYDNDPYIPPTEEKALEKDTESYKKEQEHERKRLERQAKRDEAKRLFNQTILAYAKRLLTTGPRTNILQNTTYKKSMGKGKDEVMVWMNDFAEIYKNALPSSLLDPFNPYGYLDIDKLYKDLSLTGRLNFEGDKVVMGLDYSMGDVMAKTHKPMYDGKFNKNFLTYFNEDELLGYISLNLSTQGILEAYPALLESMFTGKGKTSNEKAETIKAVVTSVTRLFSLLIDEEGAAQILRGDMLLLLTGLREKEVTYIDYEYDKDYNYKEVERTKTETVPDFLFLFTSNEEKMFRNFMKIGVIENKVTYENDIYGIPGSKSTPFDVYATYHDNTVIFSTSLQHLTQIKNGSYTAKVSAQLRKDMSKNAMSFYVNGKNIISEIPSEAYPKDLRNNIDYLTNNTKDLRMNFSKIKGNSMSGELVLKTPQEGHKNSLKYFMNMIEKLMD